MEGFEHLKDEQAEENSNLLQVNQLIRDGPKSANYSKNRTLLFCSYFQSYLGKKIKKDALFECT